MTLDKRDSNKCRKGGGGAGGWQVGPLEGGRDLERYQCIKEVRGILRRFSNVQTQIVALYQRMTVPLSFLLCAYV